MDGTEDRRFGALLRAHRTAAGLSQEELAERAQLSRRTITDLERGVTTAPYRETVALLADALKLTESDRAELENAVDRSRTLTTSEPRRATTYGPPVPVGVDPLLATKLAIPSARPVLIPRPHLMERLEAGLQGPLTLLSAPAGSGKTTLLSAWRMTPQGQEMPLAWVSLDEGDNDPTRFWRYVLAALDRAVPGAGTAALNLLHSSDGSSMEAVLTDLVNALDAHGKDVVLILDDYHLIEAQPIHRMLAFLLEHLPPSLHILLSTRADPPLPLARLRARREVVELRAADLRFTGKETTAFLNTVMGLSLSPEAVEALEARTEGWIAGLQLAGLSLQGRPSEDAATFIVAFTGSHRYIVDYLLDEVLLRQPEEVQRFLLHTCILDRLCAPLCATVLEGDGPPTERVAASQEILESLERNNVFLVALDDERRWYRYHYLFADALRQRQSGHASLPDVSVLHRRASIWFEQQDLLEEAIDHALSGGCYDRAADLIGRAAQPLGARGEMHTISTWLRALPEATLRTRPQLSLQYAWFLVDMRDLRGAEEHLHRAEAALETSPRAYPRHDVESIRAMTGAGHAVISVMQGDADRAISYAQTALTGLDASNVRAKSIAGIALGLAHLSQGAASRAAEPFREVAVANSATHYALFMVLAAVGEACAQRMAGSLDLAHITYEQAIQWSVDHSHASLLAGSLYTGLADILRERNELDAALERAAQGIRLARELGADGAERWIEWRVCNLLALARIKQAQGDLEGALVLVREAQEQLEGYGATSFATILAAHEAQLRLAQGDIEAAVRWLERAETQAAPPRFGLTPQVFVYASEHLEIAPIQVLIAQGRASGDPAPIRRALTILDRTRQRAQRLELTWLHVKTLILQALAQHLLDEWAPTTRSPTAVLKEALELARPKGYIRVFVDEGPPMADVLPQVHAHSATPDYIATLLSALEGRSPQDVPRATRPCGESRGLPLMGPLTERELDVLRLLAVGQTNPEIARTLYIELNTVKTHVQSIYGKLGVHNRMQAVGRAQELALL